VVLLHKRIIEAGMATSNDLEELDQTITQAVVESVAFARRSPDPKPESIYEDTWV